VSRKLSHEELEELITADVLDGLDESDRSFLVAELASHGPDCQECLRLLSEYSEVAGRLATALDPMPMSSGAEERLLDAARSDEGTAAEPPLSPADGPSGLRRTALRGPWSRTPRWVATAAVAASITILAGFVGYRVAPRDGQVQARFVAFAAQGGIKVVPFSTTGGRKLAVVFRPGQTGGWILGANMPGPPGDKVYELWFQPDPSAAVQPAGTFVPKDGAVLVPANLGPAFVALAVSIEPPGGSKQPTLPPVYLAPVT
jgi:hypothetical protein